MEKVHDGSMIGIPQPRSKESGHLQPEMRPAIILSSSDELV